MSTFVGVRKLNRSQKFDIGGKTIAPATGAAGSGSGATAFVNVDNPRVARDLARHTTLGALLVGAGFPFFQGDDGFVLQGCAVTPTGVNNQVAVAAGVIQTAAGTSVTVAGGNLTLTSGANPSISLVAVNTGSGALVEITGTATAGLTRDRALFGHETFSAITIPASRIVLAHVFVPAAAAPIPASAVLDTRP